MADQIDTILFDMGGTLRRNIKRDETTKAGIVQQLLDLLISDQSAVELSKLLTSREKAYEEWASKSLDELSESRLWTEWMLPDWPANVIQPISMKLNEIWREAICTRPLFPESGTVLRGLFQRGYRLGLVSNTTSSVDSPRALENAGLANYFEVMVLSCVVGKRKPDPAILLDAAQKMGVKPDHCAYVGDRPDLDVIAARAAGFGKTVVLNNPNRPFPESLTPNQTPDHFINNLMELLDIFRARND